MRRKPKADVVKKIDQLRVEISGLRESNLDGLYSLHPWRCERRSDRWEVLAYAEGRSVWETVAVISAGADGETLARFVVGLVNQRNEEVDALDEAVKALDAIVAEGVNFSTEREAERAIDRLKKLVA